MAKELHAVGGQRDGIEEHPALTMTPASYFWRPGRRPLVASKQD